MKKKEPPHDVTPSHHMKVSKQMNWIVASIFVFGETAGSGLVALPAAMLGTGFIGGIFLLLAMCLALGYTAILLGNNWMIMHKLWPEYESSSCRVPFQQMGEKACGKSVSVLVAISLNVTLFCGVAVFSVLAAKNLSDMLSLFDFQVHFCIVLLGLAIVIWPLTLLRSPAHFWQVSIGASVATILAVLFLLLGIGLDVPTCAKEVNYSEPSIWKVSFGTFVFAYTGHPVFPTIQHDMDKPHLFSRSVILGYAIMFFMYAPVSLFGYVIYGDSLSDTITYSIQTVAIRHLVNCLITLHVLFSIVIIGNPVYQTVEQLFHVKDELGIGRILVRTFVFFGAILLAASMPNFGIFLDLIGSTSCTLLGFVLPGIFALFLETRETIRNDGSEKYFDDITFINKCIMVFQKTKTSRLVAELGLIGFGITLGTISTVSTIRQMSNTQLALPCYVEMFYGSSLTNNISLSRCCGQFHNITSLGGPVCNL